MNRDSVGRACSVGRAFPPSPSASARLRLFRPGIRTVASYFVAVLALFALSTPAHAQGLTVQDFKSNRPTPRM
jgi:hypothetical protein